MIAVTEITFKHTHYLAMIFKHYRSLLIMMSLTVNPIGSYVKKQTWVGCLSFSLGNIRPLYRSSLKAHYSVSVAKNEYIVRYGIDEIRFYGH